MGENKPGIYKCNRNNTRKFFFFKYMSLEAKGVKEVWKSNLRLAIRGKE